MGPGSETSGELAPYQLLVAIVRELNACSSLICDAAVTVHTHVCSIVRAPPAKTTRRAAAPHQVGSDCKLSVLQYAGRQFVER